MCRQFRGGLQMKSVSKKLVYGLIGLVQFAALKSSLAYDGGATDRPGPLNKDGASIPAAAVDPETLIEYQNLLSTHFGISSDIMEVTYHDESQTVDLSTFDGHTIRVSPMAQQGSPNGE